MTNPSSDPVLVVAMSPGVVTPSSGPATLAVVTTVHKYAIKPSFETHELTISMPKGAKILHVDTQEDKAFLWAHVDPEKPLEDREFELYGTGHAIPAKPFTHVRHVGSFLIREDLSTFVFHLFERMRSV